MSTRESREDIFQAAVEAHIEAARQLVGQQELLSVIAHVMSSTLRCGGKILFCGNGGSAADSQHLAAEIVGRFRRERRGLPSIALTTDTSVLTAIANDYGFEAIFARQVEALGNPGDLLIGISTSGNSPNVVAAVEAARRGGLVTVAFTGAGGGQLAQLADHVFSVDCTNTARIQEIHILAGHILCDWVESDWVDPEFARIGSLKPL